MEAATLAAVSFAAPRVFVRFPAGAWGLGAGLGVAWSPVCGTGDGRVGRGGGGRQAGSGLVSPHRALILAGFSRGQSD